MPSDSGTGTGASGESAGDWALVPEPRTVAETGLGPGVRDLVLKALLATGQATTIELVEQLGLPLAVIDQTLSLARHDGAVEVTGRVGLFEAQTSHEVTAKGRAEAERALERNGYIGPAPVSLNTYATVQQLQSVRSIHVTRELVRNALSGLVLSESVIDSVTAGVAAARSLLLSGAAGNGKTAITEAMRAMLPGTMFIPYAIDVDGQTIEVLDENVHEVIAHAPRGADRRYVECRRPLITFGGELTLADLELHYSPGLRQYAAPASVRANGGILVVDDLGRQQVPPQDFLNRWIHALDRGEDLLRLQTGARFRVPFDVLVVFSTNLPLRDVGDEAFLRRIRHKVTVPDPSIAGFKDIFRRSCQRAGVAYDEDVVARFISECYANGRAFRGCHPGDLVALVCDFAAVRGVTPALSAPALREAARAYFVDLVDARDADHGSVEAREATTRSSQPH